MINFINYGGIHLKWPKVLIILLVTFCNAHLFIQGLLLNPSFSNANIYTEYYAP